MLQCGIESVKTAADVYAPVSGKVLSTNENLSNDPALVNNSAEKDGWLVTLKVQD